MRGFSRLAWGLAICMGSVGLRLAGGAGISINVVLMGGQSNMDGRSAVSQLPANLQSPQNNVEYLYQTGTAGSTSLTTGSLTTLRPQTMSGTEFGPEITFGQKIAADNPGTKYALIKYSVGSTNLASDWNATSGFATDGPQYQGFQTTVASGIADLTAAGFSPTIVGMLWLQGEADAGSGASERSGIIATNEANGTYANAYAANLTNFIGSIRSKYGSNLPFIIGGIGHDATTTDVNFEPFFSTVDGAQQSVAASVSNVRYFSDNDLAALTTPAFNDIHFDQGLGGGYQTIGDRFATAFESVPEPGSLSLLAVAGASLIGVRPRRARPL